MFMARYETRYLVLTNARLAPVETEGFVFEDLVTRFGAPSFILGMILLYVRAL